MNAILHCSDSTFGNTAIITVWHLQRGWRNCGYHFVILNGWISSTCELKEYNGYIETARPLNEEGAHTKGHNDNIGICLIGKSGKFTSQQIESCKKLIESLKFKIQKVKQHSDYDSINKPFCAGLTNEVMEKFNEGLS